MSQPLVITGMHHSGTSVVAELFKRAGVFMGERLLAPDAAKARGYFEDSDFLALEREMVAAAAPPHEPGWHDWGWTTRESLREEIWPRYEGRARKLAESRAAGHPLWGWKDPRTTLLLDFWLRILPNAKFLFVCREPWAVAASLGKLGIELFDQHPEHAVRAWSFYNRRLLDFQRRHPDRCLVLPIAQLNKTPHKILDRITARFGFAFITHDRMTCNEIVHAHMPKHGAAEKNAEKQFAAHPEALALWQELLTAAALQWDASATSARAAHAEPLPAPPPPPPRVSIVIPCRNDGAFLAEALASIDACTDAIHETVIVDDGSDDPATLDVISAIAARGGHVVRQEHLGLPAARNAGVRAAVGEFILPLDADNKLMPSYIGEAVAILDAHADIGAVYGDCEVFGEIAEVRAVPDYDPLRLHVGNYIDACAVFRRKVWDDVGGYDVNFNEGYEDWDFWLSAAAKGWTFRHIPQVMYQYRKRTGSMMTRATEPERHRRIVAQVARKHAFFAEHYADIIAHMSAMMIPPAREPERAPAAPLAAELEQAREELAHARAQLRLMQQTRSWRITSPLRAIHRVVSTEPNSGR